MRPECEVTPRAAEAAFSGKIGGQFFTEQDKNSSQAIYEQACIRLEEAGIPSGDPRLPWASLVLGLPQPVTPEILEFLRIQREIRPPKAEKKQEVEPCRVINFLKKIKTFSTQCCLLKRERTSLK